MVKVADWSGWVDTSYIPPREIPLWELWQEEDKGYGMLPSTWEFVGFGDDDCDCD